MENNFFQFEHDFWNKTSDIYHDGFGYVTSLTIPHIIKHLKIKDNNKILDIACGPGYISEYLKNNSYDISGIDFSESMINFAKDRLPKSKFQVASAEDLPFEDNSFEFVICNFGMLHFANPQITTSEAYRVLKDGGKFAYSAWNELNKSPAMSIIMEAINKFSDTTVNLPEGPPFFYYALEENSFPMLKNIGFKHIERKEIHEIWDIKSAKSFVEFYRDGGARIGGILRAQSKEALKNIIKEVENNIIPYKSDNIFKVPVSMVITYGTK